jgi:SET domain-containing protein
VAASAVRRPAAGRTTNGLRPDPNHPAPNSPGPNSPGPSNRLEIRNDPLKGRGAFASAPIAAGTVIEAAPVIIVPSAQRQLLDQTILHDYYFSWAADPGGPGGEESGAVALGLVSLCNHSRRPRARVRRNVGQGTLDLVALVPIAAGEEVTIDYNCPLWFAAQD